MAYFTEAELEARTGREFSASSTITSTMIGTMATEISAMWDGLAQQTEGTETPDEYVKQACLSAAAYNVDKIMKNEVPDQLVMIRIMKEFLKTTKTQLFYDQQYTSSTWEW
jgi:hypothetical protein